MTPKIFALGAGSAFLALASWIGADASIPAPAAGLRIGAVLDFSGPLAVHGPSTEQGARLAVAQVNAAGGVLGLPVELVVADGATDAETTVARARELAAAGADALVGPMGSVAALAVGERVSGPLAIPTLSPSATAPGLRFAKDGDFLFRTVLSDVAQGPVLARVADGDGLARLSVLYQDDAYGRGLYESFQGAFHGEIVAGIPVAAEERSYLGALTTAAAGSQGLLVIAYPGETEVIVREALAGRFFSTFLFVDANFGPDVVRAVGAGPLEGLKGTLPVAPGEELPGTQTVLDELTAHFGAAPTAGAPTTAYDAVVCLCLAAEVAGTTDGTAVRDALRRVCSNPGGARFDAGAAGVAEALAAVRRHESVDFDGSGSTLDWDEAGDVARGYVGVFRFADGQPVLVERVPFEALPTVAGRAAASVAGATVGPAAAVGR